eukprot:PhM_4_TR13956/c1_g1_i5/m.32049
MLDVMIEGGADVPLSHEPATTSEELRTPRNKATRFATLNCRTLADPTRIEALAAHARQLQVDVLALQETKRTPQAPPVSLGHGYAFHETPASTTANAGVAMILSPAAAATDPTIVTLQPTRVIAAEFHNRTVIAVYAPTCADPAEQEATQHIIDVYIGSKPATHEIIVMGDLNARPMDQVRQRSTKQVRQSAEMLEDFFERTSMHPCNVNFPGKGTPFTHRWGTLDYICVKRRFKSSAKNVTVCTPIVKTDHRMVVADIAVKWSTAKATTRKAPPKDFSVLTTTRSRREADARTRVLTDVMDARDYDDLVLRFRAAQQHLPDAPSVVQHSSWKNDTVD